MSQGLLDLIAQANHLLAETTQKTQEITSVTRAVGLPIVREATSEDLIRYRAREAALSASANLLYPDADSPNKPSFEELINRFRVFVGIRRNTFVSSDEESEGEGSEDEKADSVYSSKHLPSEMRNKRPRERFPKEKRKEYREALNNLKQEHFSLLGAAENAEKELAMLRDVRREIREARGAIRRLEKERMKREENEETQGEGDGGDGVKQEGEVQADGIMRDGDDISRGDRNDRNGDDPSQDGDDPRNDIPLSPRLECLVITRPELSKSTRAYLEGIEDQAREGMVDAVGAYEEMKEEVTNLAQVVAKKKRALIEQETLLKGKEATAEAARQLREAWEEAANEARLLYYKEKELIESRENAKARLEAAQEELTRVREMVEMGGEGNDGDSDQVERQLLIETESVLTEELQRTQAEASRRRLALTAKFLEEEEEGDEGGEGEGDRGKRNERRKSRGRGDTVGDDASNLNISRTSGSNNPNSSIVNDPLTADQIDLLISLHESIEAAKRRTMKAEEESRLISADVELLRETIKKIALWYATDSSRTMPVESLGDRDSSTGGSSSQGYTSALTSTTSLVTTTTNKTGRLAQAMGPDAVRGRYLAAKAIAYILENEERIGKESGSRDSSDGTNVERKEGMGVPIEDVVSCIDSGYSELLQVEADALNKMNQDVLQGNRGMGDDDDDNNNHIGNDDDANGEGTRIGGRSSQFGSNTQHKMMTMMTPGKMTTSSTQTPGRGMGLCKGMTPGRSKGATTMLTSAAPLVIGLREGEAGERVLSALIKRDILTTATMKKDEGDNDDNAEGVKVVSWGVPTTP